jgi:hypothetical protein
MLLERWKCSPEVEKLYIIPSIPHTWRGRIATPPSTWLGCILDRHNTESLSRYKLNAPLQAEAVCAAH